MYTISRTLDNNQFISVGHPDSKIDQSWRRRIPLVICQGVPCQDKLRRNRPWPSLAFLAVAKVSNAKLGVTGRDRASTIKHARMCHVMPWPSMPLTMHKWGQ